jgi:glycosyltransferase involved in cell wall biosynthesis
MRILTFTSLFPNQMNPNFGIFIRQRTSHLAKRDGNSVEVVAPVPYIPKFLWRTARGSAGLIPPKEEIGRLQVHHPRYPLAPGISMPLHGLLMYAGCLGYVRSLHRKHRFDCIDAHYVYPDGLAAVLIGRSLGIPVVISARGTDIHTFPSFTTVRPQIRLALRRCAGAIAVSESLAQIMLDLEPALEVQVIGNGVDGQRFFPENRRAAREKLGFDLQDRIIVSVAALVQVKGLDLLVRAASQLRQDLPRCKVVFVGVGPELGRLQQLAKELNCANICQFVGSVPNELLRTYYSAADVSCLASRKEGWSNVILESLACGIPVVATAAGAAPQILANPDLGIIVDSTPEAIQAGLCQALQQEWNREAIAASTQDDTWESVAARVEVVLKKATAPGPA